MKDCLNVMVSPNPSATHFTLQVQSNSNKTISMRVTDVAGRIKEIKNTKLANNIFTLGEGYKPGVYIVEIIQGDNRKVLKLVKQ